MILFVWSLVLSAVHFARRQRLTSVLSQYFLSPYSHETMLICRPLSASSSLRPSQFLRLENGAANGNMNGNGALWKMNSEPCIASEIDSTVIYRTGEVEIVAAPATNTLESGEWLLCSRWSRQCRSPRVAFVAHLGLASDRTTGGSQAGIELADVLAADGGSTTDLSFSNSSAFLENVFLDRTCKRLGHRRGRPWEVLYDCDLTEFYNIAYSWSESLLLDVDGKAAVKIIETVHLPSELLSPSQVDEGELSKSTSLLNRFSSLSSLNVSQRPLSLLEVLYANESEREIGPSCSRSLIASVNRCASKYRSDTALNQDSLHHSHTALNKAIESSPKRRHRSRGISLNGSFRYRACSPSPGPSLSIPRDAVPAFIKYLRDRDRAAILSSKSRSVSTCTDLSITGTFDGAEELEDRCVALQSEPTEAKEETEALDHTVRSGILSVSACGESPSSSSSLLAMSTDVRMPSRFITFAVDETALLAEKPSATSDDGWRECSKTQSEECETKNEEVEGLPAAMEPLCVEVADELRDEPREMLSSSPFTRDQTSSRHSLFDAYRNELYANKLALQRLTNRAMASTVGVANRRRHSSTLPRFYSELSAETASLPSLRRRSLSPMAFQHSAIPIDRTSIFTAESFSRQSATPTRRRFHSITPSEQIPAKPPTILVFTGDNEVLFERIAKALARMVSSDTYAVFHLSREALREHPWIGNDAACLLLADTSSLDDAAWSRLQEYFNNSGKMLFVCQNNLLSSLSTCDSSRKSAKILKMAFGEGQSNALGRDFENFLKKTLKTISKHKKVNETFHVKDPVGGYKYSVVISKNEDSPLLLYMENAAHQASALFTDATTEEILAAGAPLIADALSRLSIQTVESIQLPSVSRGYLICSYDRLPWDMEGMRFNDAFGSLPKILIRQIHKHGELPDPTRELAPVEVRTRDEGVPDFDQNAYFGALKTERLGKALFYAPICESTQDLARSLAVAMPNEPVVVIAGQQTKGRGRSGNQWLSPKGCAMFSFNYSVPPDTALADNVGFIQHIFCVAMVDGVCSLHDLQDFPLRIKWPNDIYYGRTYKMGGLLVNASTFGEKIVCTLGGGLNVANSKPTVCVNDMMPAESGIEVGIEEYIATTLNRFEYYVDIFQKEGRQGFLKHYYDFWLHSREEVTLAKTGEKVVVRGLDEHGFLEVRSRQSGRVMAVHPDGNTFDMMKGLISVKF